MDPIQIIPYVIVYGLIILTVLYFATRLYKIFIKKEFGCSSCSGCASCPKSQQNCESESEKDLIELKKNKQTKK